MTDTPTWPWTVRGSGKGSWWIDAGDGRPHGGKQYSGGHIAEIRAHHMENAARIAARAKPRQCLRCTTSFISTGPHHRCCDRCRAQS